jgi:hypothetical protein
MDNQESHNAIMMALGGLDTKTEGINRRLDILNGSVAKQADKLNAQDIMNAQTTMSQQQLLQKIEALENVNHEKNKNGKSWLDRIIWSIIIPAVSFTIILVLSKLGILNIK